MMNEAFEGVVVQQGEGECRQEDSGSCHHGAPRAWLLIAVASVGNVLGSVINWWLGRGLLHFRERRWFPVSAQALERAQARYQRFGSWSLLLSWVPIIGDPLTLAAGVMKEPLWRFLLLVTLAKTGRYLVLAAVTLQLL
ncbi:DedA family protein [Stenotrophomonas acidaminiphila]|nr:DedA family protein [Stenotrophomonas acidaminiphila]